MRTARKVHWQGLIVGKIDDQHYLVLTFSWLMGDPNCHKIVTIDEMQDWDLHANRFRFEEHYSLRLGGGKETYPDGEPPEDEEVKDLVGMWFHSFVERPEEDDE